MKRVPCAVDLSDLSVELVDRVAAIVQWYGGCLTILHVVPTFDAVEWHPGEWPPDDVDFNVPDFRTRLADNARRRLDVLVTDEAPLGRAVRTKLAIGRSHRELLATPVEQIVRASSCPVLTIRLPHERLLHAKHP